MKTYEKIDSVETDINGYYVLYLSEDIPDNEDIIWDWGVTLKAFKHDVGTGECFWTERCWRPYYGSSYFYLPRDQPTYVYDMMQFTDTSACSYSLKNAGQGDPTFAQTVQALTVQDPLGPTGEMYTWDLPWISDYTYAATVELPFDGGWGQNLQQRTWLYATGQFFTNDDYDTVIEGAAVYGQPLNTERGSWAVDYVSPDSRNIFEDIPVAPLELSSRDTYLSGSVTHNTGIDAVVPFESYINRDASTSLTVTSTPSRDNTYYIRTSFNGEDTGHHFGYLNEGTGPVILHTWCVDLDWAIPPGALDVTGGDRGWDIWGYECDAHYYVDTDSADAYAKVSGLTGYSVPASAWAEAWTEYTAPESGHFYAFIPGTYYGWLRACFGWPEAQVSVRVIDAEYPWIVYDEVVVDYLSWKYYSFDEKETHFGGAFEETLEWDALGGRSYYIEVRVWGQASPFPLGHCSSFTDARIMYIQVWS